MKRYNQFSKQVNRYSELPQFVTGLTEDGFNIWNGTVFTGSLLGSGTSPLKCARIDYTLFEGSWSAEQIWTTELLFVTTTSQRVTYISYHNESGRLFGFVNSGGGHYIFELDPANGDILYWELTNISPYAPYATGEIDSRQRFWVSIDNVLYRFNDMRDSTDRDEFSLSGTDDVGFNFSAAPDGSFIVGNQKNWSLFDADSNVIISGTATEITPYYSRHHTLGLDNNHIYAGTSGANNILGKISRDKTPIWDGYPSDGSDGIYNFLYNYRNEFLICHRSRGTNGRLHKRDLDTGAIIQNIVLGSNFSVGYTVSGSHLLFTTDKVYMVSIPRRVSGIILTEISPGFQRLSVSFPGGLDIGNAFSCSAVGGTNQKVKC